MKILYTARDFAAAKYLYHLILASKEMGHNYSVLADPEGKGLPFLREKDEETIERAEVKDFDVVVSGCSTPSGIEQKIIEEATSLGKKIILFPDTWCYATKRISCNPDLILCIDEINAEINSGYKTSVVGDPIKEKKIQKEESGNKSILLAFQSEDASNAIVNVLHNFKESDQYCICPRIHPKYAKETWAVNLLAEVFEKHIALDTETPTSVLEKNCGITISTFSGALKVSSFNGKQAVSAMSEEARKRMLESTGLDYYPLTKFGFATEITAGKSWGIKDLKAKKYNPPKFNKEKYLQVLASL